MDNFAPLFSRASAHAGADADNFDVDMLTEYLLEDTGFSSGGVTFDFNLHGQPDSSFVSPENSEDGKLPIVGDLGTFGTSPAFPMLPSRIQNGPYFDLNGIKRQRTGENQAILATTGGINTSQLLAHRMNGQELANAAANGMDNATGRGRKKSQAQIDRRRERNRILARRTRLRKKFFYESLQKEIMDLQAENERLKGIVKDNLDTEASEQILAECDALEKIPEGVMEAIGEQNELDKQDISLVQSIQRSQHSFVITDPSLEDNPIVFASNDFLKMTGYAREQVLGRNCRFLQGEDTCKEKLAEIRHGLKFGDDVTVTFLNYKADGTPFWNKLFIAALRDAQNSIVNYIGVCVELAGPEPDDLDDTKSQDHGSVNETS